jgi:RND family efflux transporter MFP subunit
MTSQVRRRRLIAAAIIVGAVIVLAVLVATRPTAQRQKPQAPVTLVTLHQVTADLTPVTVTGWGTVTPKRSVSLVPQVSGRVTAASPDLQAGAFVAAGEVLVEIEDTDYRLAVRQASAQVAQAEVALATAQEEAHVASQEWERTLADAGQGSSLPAAEPSSLVFREPQLRQAEASLDAARAALAQAELNLSRCRITAPFDARVISESADPGNHVMAGSVLGRLDDVSVAEVTVGVPDHDLAWIDTDGGPVTVRGQFAGREETWPGRAVRLGGAIDQASRTVPVVVEVADPYGRASDHPPLLAGQFVAVEFTSDPPAGSVTIPRRGLRPGDLVWILDDDDALRIREVTVLHRGAERVVLGDGLEAGDRLITSNLQYVVEGMPLRANGSPGAGAGGERR